MVEPPTPPDPSELVVVGNYPDALSAEGVRSCLEMENISAWVFDGMLSTMNGLYTNAFGGVKVMVRRTDHPRARDLLATSDLELRDDPVSDVDEITPDGIHCMHCHSPRVRSRTRWNLPHNPLLRGLTNLFTATTVTLCASCGATHRT